MIRLHRGRPYRVAWNNVPYHPARTAFLINAKCGNSSVKTALLEAEGRDATRPHRVAETWSPARVARSGYQTIGIARNPFARAVSVYHQKIVLGRSSGLGRKGRFAQDMAFTDFLEEVLRLDDWVDLHIRPQWRAMVHRGQPLAAHIFRLEDQDMWPEVQSLVPGLPALPHRNTSDAPDWRALCQGAARDMVVRRWNRDFEMFGYSTDPDAADPASAAPVAR